jgi:hypothetical protein
MTLRDALSELIGAGVERGVVVSDTEDGYSAPEHRDHPASQQPSRNRTRGE